MILKTFGWSFVITVIGLALGLAYGGIEGLLLVAILSILEISLSFDNAVVNAKILERMSDFWQKMFLTVGVVIAVFGMRLVFPLLIVGITAHLGPVEAIDLALEKGDIHEEGSYANLLDEAHPLVAAFGGMFLLLLFLHFLFDTERELHWLTWIERPLAKAGVLDTASVIVALAALAAAAEYLAEDPGEVLLAGVLGIITYLLVDGLGKVFESQGVESDLLTGDEDTPDGTCSSGPTGMARATGKAGFFLFMYVNILDASFSFDGVLGAFAITQDPIIIALGLGVGAMYIRSFTVFLVRRGTLGDYIYLEHGAMWAIGALAAILLITIEYHVDELVTGGIGLAFVFAAIVSSVAHNKRMGGPASKRETRDSRVLRTSGLLTVRQVGYSEENAQRHCGDAGQDRGHQDEPQAVGTVLGGERDQPEDAGATTEQPQRPAAGAGPQLPRRLIASPGEVGEPHRDQADDRDDADRAADHRGGRGEGAADEGQWRNRARRQLHVGLQMSGRQGEREVGGGAGPDPGARLVAELGLEQRDHVLAVGLPERCRVEPHHPGVDAQRAAHAVAGPSPGRRRESRARSRSTSAWATRSPAPVRR